LGVDNAVCLARLEEALRRARAGGHARVAGYLEAVAEEIEFETKATPPVLSAPTENP
jgi:hypothetical protein